MSAFWVLVGIHHNSKPHLLLSLRSMLWGLESGNSQVSFNYGNEPICHEGHAQHRKPSGLDSTGMGTQWTHSIQCFLQSLVVDEQLKAGAINQPPHFWPPHVVYLQSCFMVLIPSLSSSP